MKFLLSVIALCLVMITAKLYIPKAQAEVGGMDQFDLRMDYDFKRAVEHIIEESIDENDYDFKRAVKKIVKKTINDECYVDIGENYRGVYTDLYCS